MSSAPRDWCTVQVVCPRKQTPYYDPLHGGVYRIVHGDLLHSKNLDITGDYVAKELDDDNGPVEVVGSPWRVHLSAIARPTGESGMNRWFFGNFSMKESQGRHADYFVRYLSQDDQHPLQFFATFPESVDLKASVNPDNVWTEVVPGTTVSIKTASILG